jgi:hypothetical protein
MSITVTTLDYIRLEWTNSCDIDDILYQTGYTNQLYLQVDVGKPIYRLTEEGDENGNKEFIKSFQKWEKVYNIDLRVPEFMLESLTMIPLHDHVTLFLQNGQNAVIKDVVISEPVWETEGCFATVNMEFLIDSVIKTACCNDNVLI